MALRTLSLMGESGRTRTARIASLRLQLQEPNPKTHREGTGGHNPPHVSGQRKSMAVVRLEA